MRPAGVRNGPAVLAYLQPSRRARRHLRDRARRLHRPRARARACRGGGLSRVAREAGFPAGEGLTCKPRCWSSCCRKSCRRSRSVGLAAPSPKAFSRACENGVSSPQPRQDSLLPPGAWRRRLGMCWIKAKTATPKSSVPRPGRQRRLLHGLVMLHGRRVVPGSVLGLEAGNITRGHRFMGAGEIALRNAEEYEERLLKDG